MIIGRVLLRVALMPILVLITVVRLFLKATTKIYSWIIGVFWLGLIFALIMTLMDHRYNQLWIVGAAGGISFGVLFVIMFADDALKDFGDFLKAKM